MDWIASNSLYKSSPFRHSVSDDGGRNSDDVNITTINSCLSSFIV